LVPDGLVDELLNRLPAGLEDGEYIDNEDDERGDGSRWLCFVSVALFMGFVFVLNFLDEVLLDDLTFLGVVKVGGFEDCYVAKSHPLPLAALTLSEGSEHFLNYVGTTGESDGEETLLVVAGFGLQPD
jgi:hypothetical protein